MDTFVKEALALFENGIPTMDDFIEKVWLPSGKATGLAHSDQLRAIYHYVDAYKGLKLGRINSAYGFLFGSMNLKDRLPDSLDTEILINMRNEITENDKKQRKILINDRAPVLADGVEKFKAALQAIADELAKQNLDIHIDGQLNTISINDRKSGLSTDIDINELN